jgi:hypothetical protein
MCKLKPPGLVLTLYKKIDSERKVSNDEKVDNDRRKDIKKVNNIRKLYLPVPLRVRFMMAHLGDREGVTHQ